MKLKSMKRPKRSTKELAKAVDGPYEDEQWPYGLRLRFDTEDIAKLAALDGAKVGDSMRIEAIGEVMEVSKHDSTRGKPRRTVEIQIKKIGIVDNHGDRRAFNKE